MSQLRALGDRLTNAGRSTRGIIVVGVVVLLGIVPLLPPYDQYLLTLIVALSLYAVAYDLLFGHTGMVSLGHAVFFGVGGYGTHLAVSEYGLGILASLAVGMVTSMVIALAIGTLAVRIGSHGFVILTIIIVVVIQLIALTMSDITGGSDGLPFTPPTLDVGIASVSLFEPIPRFLFVFAIAGSSIALLWRIVNSPVGLVFKMIRDNERRASHLGYNTHRYKLLSFVVSGVFTGLAGSLYVYTTNFLSAGVFSLVRSTDPIIFTMLGGTRTLFGPIFGTFLVTFANDQLSSLTNAYPLFIGLVLILVVLVAPNGLVGYVKKYASGRWTSEGTDDDEH